MQPALQFVADHPHRHLSFSFLSFFFSCRFHFICSIRISFCCGFTILSFMYPVLCALCSVLFLMILHLLRRLVFVFLLLLREDRIYKRMARASFSAWATVAILTTLDHFGPVDGNVTHLPGYTKFIDDRPHASLSWQNWMREASLALYDLATTRSHLHERLPNLSFQFSDVRFYSKTSQQNPPVCDNVTFKGVHYED